MPVVHKNFIRRIEAIDQISAPGVRRENWFAKIALGNSFGGLHRTVLAIEMGIEPLIAADSSLLCACQHSRGNGEQSPSMPPESHLRTRDAGAEGLPPRQQRTQP